MSGPNGNSIITNHNGEGIPLDFYDPDTYNTSDPDTVNDGYCDQPLSNDYVGEAGETDFDQPVYAISRDNPEEVFNRYGEWIRVPDCGDKISFLKETFDIHKKQDRLDFAQKQTTEGCIGDGAMIYCYSCSVAPAELTTGVGRIYVGQSISDLSGIIDLGSDGPEELNFLEIDPEIDPETDAEPEQPEITELGDINGDGDADFAVRGKVRGNNAEVRIFFSEIKRKEDGSIDLDAADVIFDGNSQ